MRSGRLGLAGVILLLVVAVAVLFALSPIFHVRTIEVHGSGRLDHQQIQALSGISLGDNLLFLSAGSVEGRLAGSPWICSATVVKHLPSTVVISVTQRSPVAAVVSGKSYILISSDGMALTPSGSATRLPLISGVPVPPVGERLSSGIAAAAVAGSMDPATRAQVSEISVGSDGTVTATLDAGGTVTYGLPTGLLQKSEALAALLQWASGRHSHLATVDLTSPGAPAATLASSVSTPSPKPSPYASPTP